MVSDCLLNPKYRGMELGLDVTLDVALESLLAVKIHLYTNN